MAKEFTIMLKLSEIKSGNVALKGYKTLVAPKKQDVSKSEDGSNDVSSGLSYKAIAANSSPSSVKKYNEIASQSTSNTVKNDLSVTQPDNQQVPRGDLQKPGSGNNNIDYEEEVFKILKARTEKTTAIDPAGSAENISKNKENREIYIKKLTDSIFEKFVEELNSDDELLEMFFDCAESEHITDFINTVIKNRIFNSYKNEDKMFISLNISELVKIVLDRLDAKYDISGG
jgi:hypothetical protein